MTDTFFEQSESKQIDEKFAAESEIVFSVGEALETLRSCPDGFAKLILDSRQKTSQYKTFATYIPIRLERFGFCAG